MKLFLDHDTFVSYVYILFWEYSKKSDSVADKIVWVYFDGKFELFLPVLSRLYAGLEKLESNYDIEETKIASKHGFAEISLDDPESNKVFAIAIKEASRLETAIGEAVTATISEHYASNAKKYIKNQIWFSTLKNSRIKSVTN